MSKLPDFRDLQPGVLAPSFRSVLIIVSCWLLILPPSFAAIPAVTVWELNVSATAGNVNAGLLDITTTGNMMSDLTCTVATGSAADCTSATYAAVAGDGSSVTWLYIVTSGAFGVANSLGCYYLVSSVSSGHFILNSASGSGLCVRTDLGYPSPKWVATSTAGIANTASPSGGTYAVDYSQRTVGVLTVADGVCAGTTTITSVTGGFTQAMRNNGIHIRSFSSGGLADWYVIATIVDTNTVTVDKTCTTGTGGAVVVGGAMSLNSALDDALFEKGTATNGTGANRFFVKFGTYTHQAITLAAAGGTLAPIVVEGYNTVRGDAPAEGFRPRLGAVAGTATITGGADWAWYYLDINNGGNPTFTTGARNQVVNTSVTNPSATTGRSAVSISGGTFLYGCSIASYRGTALVFGSNGGYVEGCTIHDSVIGLSATANTNPFTLFGNLFEGNLTNAFVATGALTGGPAFINNTVYGAESKVGDCFQFATGTTPIRLIGNIFSGCTTGVKFADTQQIGFSRHNDFYNNTANVSSAAQWQLGLNDNLLDPQFANVVQRTGATATTTSGNHLVQSGATFQTWGITAGVDTLSLISGTGTTNTIHYSIQSVDSETQLTMGETLTANATADHVWSITQGHNFAIGTNLKALGYPGSFSAGRTLGYMDPGAAQRQEAGGQRIYPIK